MVHGWGVTWSLRLVWHHHKGAPRDTDASRAACFVPSVSLSSNFLYTSGRHWVIFRSFQEYILSRSYFWEIGQIRICSNLYIPCKDVHQTATAILFLATPCHPQGEGTSVCRKNECKINTPARLWKSQAPIRDAGTHLLEPVPVDPPTSWALPTQTRMHWGWFGGVRDRWVGSCWGSAPHCPLRAVLPCVLMWCTKQMEVIHVPGCVKLSDYQALQRLL